MTAPTPVQIRAARKARGLTQEAAAQAIGVARHTLARWERGERRPTGLARVAVIRWIG